MGFVAVCVIVFLQVDGNIMQRAEVSCTQHTHIFRTQFPLSDRGVSFSIFRTGRSSPTERERERIRDRV